MVIWSVQTDIFFRVLLLFCICCRWVGVGKGEYFTDDGCLIWGVGGGEGLLKTWIFRSATHMERGDDFELFCMRHCQLFERWIVLFTGWISIHGIAQSIFWTTGAWSIKDYLYGQKKNIFLRAKAGSPEWARWVHLARWGSQSKHIFRFILPAHEFCHIIGTVKIEVTPQVHFA